MFEFKHALMEIAISWLDENLMEILSCLWHENVLTWTENGQGSCLNSNIV